ncbi:MORC family CW-type zinc finger protein 3-like [Conger conger]|uniref:MORC family CW-type zinc finger protein 3-like n=1 Tax=Conger conger TaxID=82655 RepID=UPI002A5ABEE1|nr:MORC family CW-type zinc finger protein 3-like [Conger conger]
MAAQTDRGIPLSALSPKFLHTNSTSHTWPFSAIAELIDNAYDPDVSAKQFWIDKTRIKGLDCLTFMDNGAGMNYDKMHKMLSFGFSDKQAINGHVPVGLYGNGFKSGSMRLGKDAIVFSKTRDTMCVGLLSQTYLEAIRANHIVVPIVTFARVGHNQFRALSDHAASLQDILRYSLFKTEAELFSELRAINATCSTGSSGTRIIVWNLRRMSTGQPEFEFNVNRYDIQIPADVFESTSEKYKRQERPTQSVPESDYSLRAYCSILYLKPRMQIVIRGQKVKTQLVSKSLAYIAKDHYRPIFLNKRIRITFGYNTKSKEQYGIMMYHRNRLIKAYERVGCQLKANNRGVGVIGVIECNFLKPTHNKQDFDYTDEYRKTINNLGVKLEEYWNEIRYKRDREEPNCTIPVEDTMKRPDQNWVQCDNCLKWRKLPDGIDCSLLPEKWFCHMNPDPQFRTCHAEEEREDSDDDQPSYQKTYKQQERYNRMQQERSRQQLEQAKKKVEMQKIAALAQQNEALRRQHEDLRRQLKQSGTAARQHGYDSPVSNRSPHTLNLQSISPRTIAQTPHSITNSTRGPLGGTASSTTPLSTTRTCPRVTPSSSNMPIISSVCSLSTPSRMKRTLPLNPEHAEAKRGRLNGLHSGADKAQIAVSVETCPSSPVIIPDDDDDDLLIVEASSTPKPRAPSFDLAKVKRERRVGEDPAGMHMECSDDAAVEVPVETAAAETTATATATTATASTASDTATAAATATTSTRAASSSPATPSAATATESVTTATASIIATVSTATVTDTTTSTASPAAMETTAATTVTTVAPSSPELLPQVSTTTQTDRNHEVKDEEEEKKKKAEREKEERRKEGEAPQEEERREEEEEAEEAVALEEVQVEEVQMEVEEVQVKVEREGDDESRLGEREVEEVPDRGAELQAEGAEPESGGDRAGAEPPEAATETQVKDRLLMEAQQQQDQLMELMQAVAQERDQYQAQVHQLTCQLHDLEDRLEELTHSVVKKEVCDQATGTEEPQELYQRAKREVEELRRELQEQEAMERAGRSSPREEEEETKGSDEDEVALQVDALLRDLDQSNKERDELQIQLESVEEHRNSLLSQCEQLQRSLEDLKAQNAPSTETPPMEEHAGDQESGGPGSLGAESNGSARPGALERTLDCTDGEMPNGTGSSCANVDVSNGAGGPGGDGEVPSRTGSPREEGGLQNEVTDDGISERLQNGGSPDQSQRLGTLRQDMSSLLAACLPSLYPDRGSSIELTEQVLDELFSRLAAWDHAQS